MPRPQKLALLVAARALTPELAGEGDQELVPAVRAANPGHALVESTAVEIPVDRRLDAAAQVAVCLQPGFGCYPAGFKGVRDRTVSVPPLFRIYLRRGAKVCGPPAIDRELKTLDFLVLFDVDRMDPMMFRTFFD